MKLTMIEWRAYESSMQLWENRLKSKYDLLVWVLKVVMVLDVFDVVRFFAVVNFVELKWAVSSSCEITTIEWVVLADVSLLVSLPLGLGQAWKDEATKRMIHKTSNIFDFTLKFDAFFKFIAKIAKNYMLHFTSPLEYTSHRFFLKKRLDYLLLNEVQENFKTRLSSLGFQIT